MNFVLGVLVAFSTSVFAQENDGYGPVKPEVKFEVSEINQKRAVLPRPEDERKVEEVLKNLAKEAGWFPNIQISVKKGMVVIKGSTKNAERLKWLAETSDRIVLQSVIQNFSRTPKARITFAVNISLNDSVIEAQTLILKTLKEIPFVIDDPKPLVVADQITIVACK